LGYEFNAAIGKALDLSNVAYAVAIVQAFDKVVQVVDVCGFHSISPASVISESKIAAPSVKESKQ
jgi:hypothetical protein